jgi:dTMP kinase
VGKTTLANSLLLQWPKQFPGRTVVKLREPGSTPLGEKLRSLLLDKDGEGRPDAATELCLFCASRCDMVKRKLEPMLASGIDVILDRYWPTTLVYQAVDVCNDQNGGLNLITYLARRFHWPKPDVWVFGSAKPETLEARQQSREETNKLDPVDDETRRARLRNYLYLRGAIVQECFGKSVVDFEAEEPITTVMANVFAKVSSLL